MQNDPIVEETRKICNRLTVKFRYNLRTRWAFYRTQQVAENRVVTCRPKSIKTAIPNNFATAFDPVSRTRRRAKNVHRRKTATAPLP